MFNLALVQMRVRGGEPVAIFATPAI